MYQVNASQIASRYQNEISGYVARMGPEGKRAIAPIVTNIVFITVPKIITYLKTIKELSGLEKRQLLIDAISICVDVAFKALSKECPNKKQAKWDEVVRGQLHLMVPLAVDQYVEVDKNGLVRKKGRFTWCR